MSSLIHRDTDRALRALAWLSRHPSGPVPAPELARHTDTGTEHVRKIMQRLRRAGLVRVERGARGGYRLARPPGQISLEEVINAVQGPLKLNECTGGRSRCRYQSRCPLVAAMRASQGALRRWLGGITLHGMMQGTEQT